MVRTMDIALGISDSNGNVDFNPIITLELSMFRVPLGILRVVRDQLSDKYKKFDACKISLTLALSP